MMYKIKFRLLYPDGLGNVNHPTPSAASKAARLNQKLKPLAVVQVDGNYNPPKFSIALYCCYIGNIVEETEKAFHQFCIERA